MRQYRYHVGRPGGFMNWPGDYCQSNARIGVVIRVLFRKWFGHSPDDLVWHKDGFMAGAKDRRGNFLDVEQINHAIEYENMKKRFGSREAMKRYRERGPLALLPERVAA